MPDRLPRSNNFSLLRIIFALAVIFSHSFDLLDGGPVNQPIFRLFGTVTFGALGVDGFFIVSGYLITQSYLGSSAPGYLAKRMLRIYPGFIVASIVSVILCQLASGPFHLIPPHYLAHNLANLLVLEPPDLPNPYPGSHFPAVNGSMWTISYEFHCYLLVMLLGLAGILRRRWPLALLTSALAAAFILLPASAFPVYAEGTEAAIGAGARLLQRLRDISIGSPAEDIRLLTMFLAGASAYQFRAGIPYNARLAALSAILLVLLFFIHPVAEPAFALFGAYLIFWFALHTRPLALSNFLNRTDLSYGIYLYAFPIQKILISVFPAIGHYTLFAAASLLAAAAGYLSWTLVESPALRIKSRLRKAGFGDVARIGQLANTEP
jgi:peptidoglycan/LPS O-acetylase OafA/YrhL